MLLRLIATVLLLPALCSKAQAGEPQRVTFAGRDVATTLTAYLHRPAGEGPFPAIVALHGCGGLFRRDGSPMSRDADWAARWVGAGYAVLFPDSYGSRGLGSQCRVARRTIVPRERAGDAAAAADWLAAQTFIDKDRLALAGWSNGGSSALYAVRPEHKPRSAEFRAAIAFYPGCRLPAQSADWTSRLPLTILIGAVDDWTPPEPCRALGQRANVRYVEYAGAFHDFDAPNTPLRVRTGLAFSVNQDGRARIGTDPAARAAAIAEVARILASAFKP
jgi:dienelactone hydrolase